MGAQDVDCAPPPPGSVPDGDGVVNVVEGDRSYSSTWENAAPGGVHARSMLDSAFGWSPADVQLSPGNDWVQMDLGVRRSVSGIVSQGRGDGHNGDQWVTTYKVQHSVDGVSFEEIDGTFSANTDQTTKVTNNLANSVIARYVRILPYSSANDNHVVMRVGVVVDDVEACWTCERPSTAGYDFSSATETLSGGDSFSVSGVVCSSGYAGTVTATACSADQGDYSVSGCVESISTPVTELASPPPRTEAPPPPPPRGNCASFDCATVGLIAPKATFVGECAGTVCTPDDCCLTQPLADLLVGSGRPPTDAPPSSIGRVKHSITGAPGKYWYARAIEKLTNDDTIMSPGRVCRKMPPGSKTRYVCGPT